jgi:hypothetical protein
MKLGFNAINRNHWIEDYFFRSKYLCKFLFIDLVVQGFKQDFCRIPT